MWPVISVIDAPKIMLRKMCSRRFSKSGSQSARPSSRRDGDLAQEHARLAERVEPPVVGFAPDFGRENVEHRPGELRRRRHLVVRQLREAVEDVRDVLTDSRPLVIAPSRCLDSARRSARDEVQCSSGSATRRRGWARYSTEQVELRLGVIEEGPLTDEGPCASGVVLDELDLRGVGERVGADDVGRQDHLDRGRETLR